MLKKVILLCFTIFLCFLESSSFQSNFSSTVGVEQSTSPQSPVTTGGVEPSTSPQSPVTTIATEKSTSSVFQTTGALNEIDKIIESKLATIENVIKNGDYEPSDQLALELLKAKLQLAMTLTSKPGKEKALGEYHALLELFGLQSLLPEDDPDTYELYDYGLFWDYIGYLFF